MFWVNIKIYYFQFYYILCLHIYDVQLNGAVLRCSYITPHFLINEIPVFTIKIHLIELKSDVPFLIYNYKKTYGLIN